MENYQYVPDMILENSRMINRNFEGRATKFKKEGDRGFNVVIDEENVEMLREQGWTIKMLPPREGVEDSKPLYFIEVRVNMESARPPKIYLITSKKKIKLDAESVGTIDHAEIKHVDMVVHPHFWSMPSGKSGIKAYLKELYVTIEEEVFADKYQDLEFDEDDVTNVF